MATSVTLKPNAIDISGSTSGTTTLQASAVAGTTTLTLPAATDTLVGKATTDTLTNKTLTGAAMNGTLGATTPSTASVTTLTTSSTVTHSGGTANGVAYLDGSKVLTTGSALVFDGTNLGLGVTPSAWKSNYKAQQINSLAFASAGGGYEFIYSNAYINSSDVESYIANGYATAYLMNQAAGKHIWYTAPSGTAGNAISFTQAMTLDASNNLLLGTTTASANFYVYGAPVSYAGLNTTAILSSSASQSTGTGGLLAFEGKYTSGGALANFAAIGGLKENSTDSNYAGYLGFYTRSNGSLAAERARIDSSGNLLVAGTSTSGINSGGGFYVNANSLNTYTMTSHVTGSASGSPYAYFYYANSYLGQISQSGTTGVNYTSASDYRLKNITGPLTGAKEFIMALQPKQGTWKSDGSRFVGFLAHEFQEVSPSSVSGEKDAVDEDGNPIMQSMQASSPEVMANLVAFIQEQQALITQLQADVAALKGA